MAGFGKMLAEGATSFAAGVYKNMDSQAGKTARKVFKDMDSSAISKKIATTKTTGAYKAGKAFGASAPMSGITASARNMTNNIHAGKSANIMGSIKQGHMKSVNGQQVLDMKKVAGTAATVGVAGRVATGGGLYRDRYGNVNVPGLPFI